MNAASFLADVVVVIHLAYVAFVLFGLLFILAGNLLKWKCVRNFWFRMIHLSMILVVVFEALYGIVCPLTTLENYLRVQAGQTARDGSFIGQAVHDILFYDAPPWVFTIAYCIFGGLVLLTFVLVPPQWRKQVR